jgi:pyridoxamine 5'-phosphate oxidase
MSTSADNEPFVRGLMLYKADEDGLIFSTFKQKDLYKQLQKNNRVEVCFYNADQGKQLRIHGSIEFVDDDDEKKEIIKKFRFLRAQVAKVGLDSFVVLRLAKGMVTTWTLATAFDEKIYFDF